jgi:sulfur-carrier protein
MAAVRIPPTLRAEVGGARELEADGDTVAEVIDDLVDRYPPLGAQLLQDGELAPFVNVYVGGEDVRTRDGLDTEVRSDDKLILDRGDSLAGRLLLFDALSTTLDEVTVRRNPDCPVCGDSPTITEYVDYVEFCNAPVHL